MLNLWGIWHGAGGLQILIEEKKKKNEDIPPLALTGNAKPSEIIKNSPGP